MFYSVPKASLKRRVLLEVLKRSKLSIFLTHKGKVFHSLGATVEKALSPAVFIDVDGMSKSFLSADLRFFFRIMPRKKFHQIFWSHSMNGPER